MASEIKMPQLSDTMHSGKILSWLKKEGDTVSRGDFLAEVETDKANLQIECFTPGTLLKIMIPAEQVANVGDIIAYIGQPGEAVGVTGGAPAPKAAAPAPQPAASEPAPQPVAATPITAASAYHPAAASSSRDEGGRIKVSPLARKIAEQKHVDLTVLKGTGPQGRIVRKDVEQAALSVTNGHAVSIAAAPTPVTARAPQAEPVQVPREVAVTGGTLTPLSKMRETIARRMQESVTTAPHFYVTTTVNMKEAIRLREILKEKPEYKGISINHLVIKAVAYGLKNEPRCNAAMKDGQLYQPAQINIGVITAIEGGLLIPVVKEADALPLKDLVFEARAAIERARAGRPNSSDLTGGTFSISNMGMFDVENFTAIINPGQGGILAVSSIKEEPVVDNGAIVIGSRMKATVSVDHRIIDGVMAGTFLKFFKEALETPALLMV